MENLDVMTSWSIIDQKVSEFIYNEYHKSIEIEKARKVRDQKCKLFVKVPTLETF